MLVNYNCISQRLINDLDHRCYHQNKLVNKFSICFFLRVVRNTRNPVYDEDFTFYGLSLSELSAMSLHFVVLSFDRYSRDDVIGEVIYPMSSINLKQIENQQVALSREIHPRCLKVCVCDPIFFRISY